jgi:hypothetical protein
MWVFPVREHPLDVAVQRSHDADPRMHQRQFGLSCSAFASA